jgi:hypothetical protein
MSSDNPLDSEELKQLRAEVARLKAEREPSGLFACFVEEGFGSGEEPSECVLDDDDTFSCIDDDTFSCINAKQAKQDGGKHTCKYWRPVHAITYWKTRCTEAERKLESIRSALND